MIFPILEFEKIVQSNDKTRLDASKSFSNGGEVFDLVTIVINGSAPIDITTNLYVDYIYDDADAGDITVTLSIDSGITNVTKDYTQTVKTAVQDNLFSNDDG